jgi:serine/threonine-protein kinase
VQIYEVGEYHGHPYFTQEFVAGGNLAQKLAGGPLPAHQAAQWVEALARAIGAIHQSGPSTAT